MITVKATIFFEKRHWIAVFERTDKEGYAIAKHIFGKEPTDPEIYEFVLNHYDQLNYGSPKEFSLVIKRQNPKRVQREVRKEMEKIKQTTKPSTFAQNVMREDLEKGKKEKKKKKSFEKLAYKEEQFVSKQMKKKEKHRGH